MQSVSFYWSINVITNSCFLLQIAAFIAEPVMGAGGVILPPATYFEKVFSHYQCFRHEFHIFKLDEGTVWHEKTLFITKISLCFHLIIYFKDFYVKW